MKNKILRFLKNHQIITLSTVDVNNHPNGAVILYVVDESFNIFFATHDDSKKAININNNKAVSLTVWEHDNLSLQIEGEAKLVSDRKTIDSILDKLALAATKETDNFYPPILRINKDANYSLFKIKPKIIQYLDLSEPHIKESKPVIKVIKL